MSTTPLHKGIRPVLGQDHPDICIDVCMRPGPTPTMLMPTGTA